MITYISLLRGINVGGKNTLNMINLTRLYEVLGLLYVKSYIQSGNVIFQSEIQDSSFLSKKIKETIMKNVGIHIEVLVITQEYLKNTIKNIPFCLINEKNEQNIYVTFLFESPKFLDKNSLSNKLQQNEAIELKGEVSYLYCSNGYGKTKLTNSYLEKALGVYATTRNWKTTLKLFELSL